MPDLLDIPLDRTDIGDVTLGVYLGSLLATLWDQAEGFSGKRPFGNSGWKSDVYRGLVKAGVIAGQFDPDGWLESCDEHAGNVLIDNLIVAMFHLPS